MPKLNLDAVKLLEALTDQAARAAGGAQPTIDALELARRIDPDARAPYRNKQATADALAWCRAQGLPPLVALVVIDKAYPQPESALLVSLYGALPRTEQMGKWQADVQAASALSALQLARAREALAAARQACEPARTRQAGGARAQARAGAGGAARARTRQAGGTGAPGASGGTHARSAAGNGGAGGKNASGAPGRSGVRVRVAAVDAQAFAGLFETYCQLVAELAPGEPLFANGFTREHEGDPVAAWEAWDAQLGIAGWTPDMVGSGLVAEAVQATVDDPRAVWLAHADDAKDLRALCRRGAHRMDGLALLEGALLRFYLLEMEPREFLDVLRELLGRHYGLCSHLLFLRDAREFTPVVPRAAEEGLRRLGVEASMAGYCTWDGYSRLLAHLDRMADLAEQAGRPRPTRPQAQQFLHLAGAGFLD